MCRYVLTIIIFIDITSLCLDIHVQLQEFILVIVHVYLDIDLTVLSHMTSIIQIIQQ